jgi:tetratricopeptide (TPR) repeat protein
MTAAFLLAWAVSAQDPPSFDPAAMVRELPPREALEALERAAERLEEAPAAATWWWIGWLRYRGEDWAGAREAFHRSIAGNPSFTNALLYAARASFALGEPGTASEDLLRLGAEAGEGLPTLVAAAEGETRSLRFLVFTLADRAFREGNLEKARDLFGVVTLLEPADVDAWNNLAFVSRQTGRYREAWRAYVRAAGLRRDDARLWNDAALIQHYHLGEDPALARAMYERAIECASALLLDSRTSGRAREAAQSVRKDAEENLRRLLEGRRGPPPLR